MAKRSERSRNGQSEEVLLAGSWEEKVVALLKNPHVGPLTKSGLARALDLDPKERASFRSLLRRMETDGLIVCGKKQLYSLRAISNDTLTGTIRQLLERGGALFTPDMRDPNNRGPLQSLGYEIGHDARLLVPPRSLNLALPGDRVVVKAGPSLDDPTENVARVIKITERSDRPLLATLISRGKHFAALPDSSLYPSPIELGGMGQANERRTLKAGNKVLVVIDEWAAFSRNPKGHVVKDLGPPGAKGQDMTAIIYKFGLRSSFPPEVIREAEAISPALDPEEIAAREDWRERDVFTIDPFDARDFDDAIAVEELRNGHWELAVHIADVSHYVAPGSALDHEAEERGNSTYLADRVIPMLPEVLSNGLCSLQPSVERYSRLCLMTFDAKGQRLSARFAKSVIRSKRRFTYEEAYAVLKAPTDGSFDSRVVHTAWRLAALLRQQRMVNGALDLDFPETRVVLDKEGKPQKLARIDHDESHQLIEEFMLAANDAVAEAARISGLPALYRVHEDPDPSRLLELRATLASFGLSCGDLSHRKELQRVLKVMGDNPEAQPMKLEVLKSLKRAVYLEDPMGHYGLAKRDYAHFTSPIRRYADLVLHRTLEHIMARQNQGKGLGLKPTPKLTSYQRLGEIGAQLSTTERTSADAERESQQLKQAEYFLHLSRLKQPPAFEARVVEVKRSGVMVELNAWAVRGFVPYEDFLAGEWHFEPVSFQWRSRRPKFALFPGQNISVIPTGANMERRFIDFRISAISDDKPSASAVPTSPRSFGERRKSQGKSAAKRSSGSQKGKAKGKTYKSDGKHRSRQR